MNLLSKLLIALLIVLPASAAELLSPNPIDWKPVVGYNNTGTRGYYDKNSIHEIKDSNKRIVFGNLLIVSDNVVEGRMGPKVYKARSMVRIVMINCTDEYIIPIFDLYYLMEFPMNADTPVHAIDHGESKITVPVNRKSPLYYILCPNYI